MVDQVLVDNGTEADYTVSTDDCGASGHAQRVKLAYSADGVATHVTADADGLLVNLGANNDVTVSGVATAANQTTVIGHLDGVEGLLTTIDADTSSLQTAMSTFGAAIVVGDEALLTRSVLLAVSPGGVYGNIERTTGGNLKVAVEEFDTSLPAGTNNIGDVDVASIAAGDNNIGNVDIVTMPAVTGTGTFAVQVDGAALTALQLIDNLVLTEDVAHASGNPGVLAFVVRSDAGGSLVSDDGDNSPLQVDASGALRVTGGGGGTEYTEDAAAAANPVGTATILVRADTPGALVTTDGDNVAQRGTNYGAAYSQIVTSAGAFVDTFGGGTQYTEDAAAAADPVGNALIMVRDDVLSAQTTTDGDNIAARGTDKGELYVKHVDAIPVTDNGGVLTVDGTVAVTGTVDLGATDNAVLDAIAASVAAIDVDATTIIGHVDGIEGLLGTIDADTGSILTSVQVSDNVVVVLGTDTYTEATSSGTVMAAVRRDADTTLANTTNEYTPLQVDANGRLKVEAFSGESLPVTLTSTTITGTVAVTQSGTWDEVGINDSGNSITVDAPVGTPAFVRLSDGAAAITTLPVSLATVPSHAVTNVGVFAVQVDGAALTALQLADDVVVTLGTDTYTETTSKGSAIGAVRRDADTTLVNTTNEWGPLQMDANGRLKVEAFSGEALPVTLTSTTITGTVAVTDNASSLTVDAPVGTPVFVRLSDGSAAIATLPVSLASLPASTNTLEVVGDGAHDVAIAGNPVRISARGISADYTAVTTGDTADLISTLLGKLVTKPYALPGQQWQFAGATGGITDTTAVTIKAAGAAGVRNYVTDLQVVNGHATVSTEFAIRDGAGGTVIYRGWAQAAGGGISIKFGTPLRGTAATLLEVVCITTGSATRVSAQGYEGAE